MIDEGCDFSPKTSPGLSEATALQSGPAGLGSREASCRPLVFSSIRQRQAPGAGRTPPGASQEF